MCYRPAGGLYRTQQAPHASKISPLADFLPQRVSIALLLSALPATNQFVRSFVGIDVQEFLCSNSAEREKLGMILSTRAVTLSGEAFYRTTPTRGVFLTASTLRRAFFPAGWPPSAFAVKKDAV